MWLFMLLFCSMASMLSAQTIAEKKASTGQTSSDLSQESHEFLIHVNKELLEANAELASLYEQVMKLFERNAPEIAYKDLLDQINGVKGRIEKLENSWREMAASNTSEDAYGLWHQPDTTIGQLVIDYGSPNYVYILPPEISGMKLSVDSNLPIPRAGWNQMLELILAQNGVGIRQLNPYLRQLFLLKQDKAHLRLITNNRRDLEIFPDDARISFVITPQPEEVRRVWLFLEKFVNPNTTVLQMIGRDILIIAQVAEVRDLLKLYDFVSNNRGDKEYKIVPLLRIDPIEMAKILTAVFDQHSDIPRVAERSGGPRGEKGAPPRQEPQFERTTSSKEDANGLRILTLEKVAQGIFLIGTREEIKKAEEIIRQVESRIGGAREKEIYYYACKHSDPEDLADILERIYNLMIRTGTGIERRDRRSEGDDGRGGEPDQRNENGLPPNFGPGFGPPFAEGFSPPPPQVIIQQEPQTIPLLPVNVVGGSFYQQGGYVVNPMPAGPEMNRRPPPNMGRMNFVVNLKTSSIVMVVEADILPKLKELIRKLDVPKKQVQIETMLFEKRINRDNSFGLNLLKLGDCASQTHFGCVNWNDPTARDIDGKIIPGTPGLLQFLFSGLKSSGIPAYDIAYRFLISQGDVQVNTAPTVVTTNQTPAVISIVDELSINVGTFTPQTTGGTTTQFTRAQYGATIIVTPTIHMRDENDWNDDSPDYITLETDITFDTPRTALDNNTQPIITRRSVKNIVSIPEGQAVIIGGLRSKRFEDHKQSIPYLGEVPGLGKLFSTNTMSDESIEMFIFITPKIISDPVEDFERLRCENLSLRPGDIPEFLCCLANALECERCSILEGTVRMLFGRRPDRCIEGMGEYDGR